MPKGRPNQKADCFKLIDMKGGDQEQCWPWIGKYTKASAKKNDPNDVRPVFRYMNKDYNAYRFVLHLVDPTFNIDDPKDYVLHQCDNKGVDPNQRCCNPKHLKHGTHEDNMREMAERERAGLPAHVVRYIRKLLREVDDEGQSMFTHEQIARRYGISRQTVSAINSGERYQHVKDEEINKGETWSKPEQPLSPQRQRWSRQTMASTSERSSEENQRDQEAGRVEDSNRIVDEPRSEE